MPRFSFFGLVLAAAVSGAQQDCYARMDPGNACGSCHVAGKGAPVFGAAGTLYDGAQSRTAVAGATLEVTDRDGEVVTVVTNDVGNFYTPSSLTPPLQVKVTKDGLTAAMRDAPNGDCNSCHASGPTPGRIHLP